MYNNSTELINSELNYDVRKQFYPIFDTGIKTYNDLLRSNYQSFDSAYFPNIKGRLFNFLLYRQFEKDMLSNNFPFTSKAEKVNNFGHRNLKLKSKNDNLILNIAKARNEHSLPSKSKYRLANCSNNRFTDRQLIYDFCDDAKIKIKENLYYVFITYKIKNGEFEFLNLMIPDESMNTYMDRLELKAEFTNYNKSNDNKNEEVKEKKILTLKKEALQEFNIK